MPVECNHCDQVYENKTLLLAHKDTSHPVQHTFNYKPTQIDARRTLVLQRNSNGLFVCPCSRKILSLHNMSRHATECNREKSKYPFECDICGSTFKNERALKNHETKSKLNCRIESIDERDEKTPPVREPRSSDTIMGEVGEMGEGQAMSSSGSESDSSSVGSSSSSSSSSPIPSDHVMRFERGGFESDSDEDRYVRFVQSLQGQPPRQPFGQINMIAQPQLNPMAVATALDEMEGANFVMNFRLHRLEQRLQQVEEQVAPKGFLGTIRSWFSR